MGKRIKKLLFVVALLLCAILPVPVWSATPTVSQAKSAQCVAATCAVTISTTSGHLIVVFAYSDLASGTTLSVTDSASQSYSVVTNTPKTSGGTNGVAEMFYKANSAALTSVTCNASTSGTLPCVVYEIAGAATGTPFNSNATNAVTSANTATGTSLATGSALSTNNANDILVYGVGENATTTGWTAGTGYAIATGGSISGGGRAAVQTKGVSASGSQGTTTMSWTTTGADRIGVHAAFAATNQGGAVCKPTLALLGEGRCG